MAHVARSARGKRQVMTLGTTPMVGANILPRALREYRRPRPELRVRLYDADQDTFLREVQKGRLDAGVGLFKSVPGVRGVPVFRFSLAVIRARRHGDAAGAPIPWAALDGETVIALGDQPASAADRPAPREDRDPRGDPQRCQSPRHADGAGRSRRGDRDRPFVRHRNVPRPSGRHARSSILWSPWTSTRSPNAAEPFRRAPTSSSRS